jgi:hypothetical protein
VHCELIVPALLPQSAEIRAALAGLRLPSLELLLARGRRSSDEAVSLETWLVETFEGDPDRDPPAGALTLAASGAATGDAEWMRADPAHLRLNRDQLVLVPGAAFQIQLAEAEALVETLNRHFAGQLTFYPVHADRWCVRVEEGVASDVRTETPLEVAGKDINRHLPTGTGATRWHALLNEMQMVLHEHAVNEAREARGEPAINSVWLWGAGRMPAEAAAQFQSVTAEDALALGFAKAANLRHRLLPGTADEWLGRLPEDGRHLAILDALRMPAALGDPDAWRSRLMELERAWFTPLLAALKGGRIGMVTVLVPDAEYLRAFESTRHDLRHFWRRLKPLERYQP